LIYKSYTYLIRINGVFGLLPSRKPVTWKLKYKIDVGI